jgi:signal transduction histidine kinase
MVFPFKQRLRLRKLPLLSACVLLLAGIPYASVSISPAQAEPPNQPGRSPAQHVLVVYPDNPQFQTTGQALIDQTLREQLQNSGEPVEIYTENLERIRLGEASYDKLMADFYRRKYRNDKVDVIVAVQRSVLHFFLKHHSDLFKGVPIVFCIVEAQDEEVRALPPDVTGVLLDTNFGKTVDAALQLQPQTERIVVLSGASDTDRWIESLASRQLQNYQNRVQIEYWEGLTVETARAQLAHLPPHTAVFYLTEYTDHTGREFTPLGFLGAVAPYSRAPIYSISTNALAQGSVGGYVYDSQDVATRTARLAREILQGSPLPHPLVVAGDIYVFNWRELQRWGIPESRLPAGSIVQFHEPTLWARYRPYILAALVFTLIETLLLALLLVEMRRSKRTQALLKHQQEILSLALEASHTGVWDWNITDDRVTWSEQNQALFGEKEPNLITTYQQFLSLIHHEDRRKIEKTMGDLIADSADSGASDFGLAFRVVYSRAAKRWILCKGRLFRDASGRAVRMLGVNVDVTDLELTQLELRRLTARLIQAQDDERQRIARELHDNIGQRVSLLMFELDLLKHDLPIERDAEHKSLSKLLQEVDELATDLHEMSHRLHSSKLKHLGLRAALKELCQQVSRLHRLEVHLQAEDLLEPLPEEIALCLYRVAQEALNNVVKHSGASQIAVSVAKHNNVLCMRIKDYGRGFDPAVPADGLGLASMRERLRMVAGELQVNSKRGSGTELVAEVTIKRSSFEEKAS